MKNLFTRLLSSLNLKRDTESELTYGLSRFFTFFLIFLSFPTEGHFRSFISLNSAISCTEYVSFEQKVVLTPELIAIMHPVLLAALLCSAIGFFFSISSVISFGLFSIFILHTLATCYSNHVFYPIGLILLLWVIGGNPSRFSLDFLIFKRPPSLGPNYLFLFLKINFSLVFFYAAMSKLTNSGFAWIDSDSLRNMLILQNLFHEGFPAQSTYQYFNRLVVDQPVVSNFLALSAVSVEAAAILILPFRAYGRLIVVALALLQMGIHFTLYISFSPWLVLYLVWIFSYLDEVFLKRGLLERWRHLKSS